MTTQQQLQHLTQQQLQQLIQQQLTQQQLQHLTQQHLQQQDSTNNYRSNQTVFKNTDADSAIEQLARRVHLLARRTQENRLLARASRKMVLSRVLTFFSLNPHF
ncbi:hypothetical protein MTR_4g037695 [Medicago truncatula]|uniref:Uncharacterized protein n=1 Tax=Medicago truncatula TaxID=3880 RepID=A0A072UUF8_MEDTR|nr:hypothetical protein MTR_4g037695 [Medicago truncatula]